MAAIAGWSTPRANKWGFPDAHGSNEAPLTGWNTPRATDGSNVGPNQAGGALPADAALAGWATPRSTDAKCGHSYTENCEGKDLSKDANLAIGLTSKSSLAPTEKRGALNPEHSAWLMGYPKIWTVLGRLALLKLKKK